MADDANGRRLLDFANRLIAQFIRIAPSLVAVDRIEDVADMDRQVAATADDGEPLALDESIDDELQLLVSHCLAPEICEW